jgi:hypothetical protein
VAAGLSISIDDTIYVSDTFLRLLMFSVFVSSSSLRPASNPSSPRLACIDSVRGYISRTQSETDPIRDAMMDAIAAFPPTPSTGPAQPQSDDPERVMDRRVLFDEPHMQNLIRSLNDEGRTTMNSAADRERARLPLFPACFVQWEV